MNFQSDNQSSVFPEIIDYLKIVNNDPSPAYGADEVTKLATNMLKDLFETNLKVLFVSSGKPNPLRTMFSLFINTSIRIIALQ